MLKEVFKAFLLVFIAEMGDKSQIIALTFATKYSIKNVISGVAIGVVANHGLAIILGRFISKTMPLNFLQTIAGFMFIIFGYLSLQDEELDEFEESRFMNPIVTVSLAFFLGELGDKTQLTAVALAVESKYILTVLFGTTLAMIGTSIIGIFIGIKIGNSIPELPIKIASSLIFIITGLIKLFNIMPSHFLQVDYILIFLALVVTIEVSLIYKLVRIKIMQGRESPLKKAAHNIHLQMETLNRTLDSICLGEEKCGRCSGSNCLIGYVRELLKNARKDSNYYGKYQLKFDTLIKKTTIKKRFMRLLC